MDTTTSHLNELIEVLHDGSRFYLDAASEMRDSGIAPLFRRMASGKRAIATELAAHVAARGEPVSLETTTAGGLREAYAKFRVALTSDKEGRYIAELESTEDRILRAFDDAVARSNDSELATIASRHLPEVNAAHEQMRALKHQRGY